MKRVICHKTLIKWLFRKSLFIGPWNMKLKIYQIEFQDVVIFISRNMSTPSDKRENNAHNVKSSCRSSTILDCYSEELKIQLYFVQRLEFYLKNRFIGWMRYHSDLNILGFFLFKIECRIWIIWRQVRLTDFYLFFYIDTNNSGLKVPDYC